jgi:hypothetical protein
MFVKFLVLLFSNVFVSFNVLVCSRLLNRKCGLKGELVLVSAIDRTRATIKCTCDRA